MTTPPAPDDPAEEFVATHLGPEDKPQLLPEGLFGHMRADPLHAPEYLALAAVDQFGPEAQKWVADFHRTYPHVADWHLAAVTRKRFVRLSAASGAVAGVAGAAGAVVDFGVLAWNQARMVIYLATIFGADPTDRERAAELLMLTGVHKVVGAAQTALDIAARKAAPSDLLQHSSRFRGADGSLLTLAMVLAKMGGMKLAKRGVLKLIPVAAVPLGAWANSRSSGELADKAINYYAQRRNTLMGYPGLPLPPKV